MCRSCTRSMVRGIGGRVWRISIAPGPGVKGDCASRHATAKRGYCFTCWGSANVKRGAMKHKEAMKRIRQASILGPQTVKNLRACGKPHCALCPALPAVRRFHFTSPFAVNGCYEKQVLHRPSELQRLSGREMRPVYVTPSPRDIKRDHRLAVSERTSFTLNESQTHEEF